MTMAKPTEGVTSVAKLREPTKDSHPLRDRVRDTDERKSFRSSYTLADSESQAMPNQFMQSAGLGFDFMLKN